MKDPEIRDLQIATARAYAIAERLAHELEGTVTELMEHVTERPKFVPADTANTQQEPRRRR